MLGILLTEKEQHEIEYLIRRELDELLFDFQDERLEGIVKRAMEEKYRCLYRLFMKVSSPEMCLKYMRVRKF